MGSGGEGRTGNFADLILHTQLSRDTISHGRLGATHRTNGLHLRTPSAETPSDSTVPQPDGSRHAAAGAELVPDHATACWGPSVPGHREGP